MTLMDCVDKISDDFQSTFMYVSEHQLVNMLRGDHEFDEVRSIIRKYLGEVRVEFLKTGQVSSGPYDIYNIVIIRPEDEIQH